MIVGSDAFARVHPTHEFKDVEFILLLFSVSPLQ